MKSLGTVFKVQWHTKLQCYETWQNSSAFCSTTVNDDLIPLGESNERDCMVRAFLQFFELMNIPTLLLCLSLQIYFGMKLTRNNI